MRSIVTGGAGFIGSHLCEQLIKLGHKVFVIDNFSNGKIKNLSKIKNKITIIKQDIRNYKKIQKKFKNIDNVFHLAALSDIVPSIEKPDEYFTTNVDGTFNVLKASHQNKIKRFGHISCMQYVAAARNAFRLFGIFRIATRTTESIV